MKTINRQVREITSQKEQFSLGNPLIKNFGLSTRQKIKDILALSESGEQIETFVTLCPFYNKESGGISGEFGSFEDVPLRYRQKLEASIDAIGYLKRYFNLKVTFLLADKGVMISDSYNKGRFLLDIGKIKRIYFNKISQLLDDFNMSAFSEIGINIKSMCNVSEEKSITQILSVLQDYEIDYKKFKPSLDIIIKAFGVTGAYYLILNYLKENDDLIRMYENAIILNTEVVSPLNGLYIAGKNKLNSKNVFARVDINS